MSGQEPQAGRKVALIAGGTKGIGLAIAKRFAQGGFDLFLNYHADDTAAQQAIQHVRADGAQAWPVKSDIATAMGGRAAVEQVRSRTKHLDAIVHCSAVANPGDLAVQDVAEIERAISVGGMSLLYLLQPARTLLRKGSSVVFLSGKSVEVVLPRHGALATGKALGECLARYLAIEYASSGVNINTLRVGPIDTELFRAATRTSSDAPPLQPPVTPNGRQLTGEDVAEVALFLASPRAFMVQGQTVTVDGGLSTTIRGR